MADIPQGSYGTNRLCRQQLQAREWVQKARESIDLGYEGDDEVLEDDSDSSKWLLTLYLPQS